jgi:hypothetical protein
MKHDSHCTEIVATYEDDFRADIARVKLLTARIACEIVENSVFRWNPFAAKTPGTYTVLVKRNDVMRARKILKVKM